MKTFFFLSFIFHSFFSLLVDLSWIFISFIPSLRIQNYTELKKISMLEFVFSFKSLFFSKFYF
jgi:hypothetical protein